MRRITARPAAPPTTPPAIVPGGVVLSLVLLCWTLAVVLLEGDEDVICPAVAPATYAVEATPDGAVLDVDVFSGDCWARVLS